MKYFPSTCEQKMVRGDLLLSMNASSRRAFTLIELLFVIAIVAVLFGLGYGTLQVVSDKGRKIKEVSAARTLVNSFLGTTQDHDGTYILGYDQNAAPITLPGGNVISGQPACRYPYRLAAYFNYQFKDTVLVNYNVTHLPQGDITYLTSLNPALGMNSYFVGGNTADSSGNINFPADCMRRPGMSDSALLVLLRLPTTTATSESTAFSSSHPRILLRRCGRRNRRRANRRPAITDRSTLGTAVRRFVPLPMAASVL